MVYRIFALLAVAVVAYFAASSMTSSNESPQPGMCSDLVARIDGVDLRFSTVGKDSLASLRSRFVENSMSLERSLLLLKVERDNHDQLQVDENELREFWEKNKATFAGTSNFDNARATIRKYLRRQKAEAILQQSSFDTVSTDLQWCLPFTSGIPAISDPGDMTLEIVTQASCQECLVQVEALLNSPEYQGIELSLFIQANAATEPIVNKYLQCAESPLEVVRTVRDLWKNGAPGQTQVLDRLLSNRLKPDCEAKVLEKSSLFDRRFVGLVNGYLIYPWSFQPSESLTSWLASVRSKL